MTEFERPLIRPATADYGGVVFEVPVWDHTPTEWNKAGSWAKDPALTEQVLLGIRKWFASQGIDESKLLKAAKKAQERKESDRPCRTFWGSHGCGLKYDHSGLHVCFDQAVPHMAIYEVNEKEDEFGTVGGDAIAWHVYLGDDEFSLSAFHWTWFW